MQESNQSVSGDNPQAVVLSPSSDPRSRGRVFEVVRALLGMSRAIVAVFVVAHAGLASIFATGHLPEIETIVIGVFACLFGTGALIGLNDLLDVNLDRRRMARANDGGGLDLGSLFIHHPVAKGVISMRTGIIWVGILAALSLAFINALKPGLWPIFFSIAVFVVLYSTLGSRTYWKFMAVAMAVTLGALAGWLTVSEKLDWPSLLLFGIWTFLWEIGGRNIPNDFNDLEEDAALGVKTIPVVLGPRIAGRVVFWTLLASTVTSLPLMLLTGMPPLFIIAATITAVFILLVPGFRLMRDPRPEISQMLYNKSAIYPLVLLILIMANILLLG